VKRRDLINKIRTAATGADVAFGSIRDRGDHEVFSLGGIRLAIPRHREIAEGTAQAILKRTEPVLGKGWWR
jgi:hypothetical protein